MIDVDHFKLLQRHLSATRKATPASPGLAKRWPALPPSTMGFAGRYGGEEFCLLLPNTSPTAGAGDRREWCGRPCRDLGMPHMHLQPPAPSPSASASPATAAERRPEPRATLIEAADAASMPPSTAAAIPWSSTVLPSWWMSPGWRWRGDQPRCVLRSNRPSPPQPVDPAAAFVA